MAIDRGSLAGLTYTLPQAPVTQPTVQQPYNDGIEALQGIQHVQGQTSDYYTKVAKLKSFMQEASNNYGIDVRVPDLSKPESIKLHEIYNTALSDILTQGNLLKNSQGLMMMRDQRGIHYTGDPTATPAALMRERSDFFERPLEGQVGEVNNLTQQASYTDEEQAQKEGEYKKAVDYYTQLAEQDPTKKSWADAQIAGLTKPARATKMFAPRSDYQNRNWGRKVNAAGNILKKITNLADGAHDSFIPDAKQLNANGKPYLFSKEFYGQKIGDGIVSSWRHDPDTGETDIIFQDGRLENVSTQDPRTITSQLTRTDPNAIEEYVSKNRLDDEYGQVDKAKLLGEGYDRVKKRNIAKADKLALTTGPAVEELTSKISNMKSRAIGKNDVVNAGRFEIEKNWGDDAYIIRNLKAIRLPASFKTAKEAESFYRSYSKWPDNDPESLSKWLIKQGAHMEDWKSKQGQPAQAPVEQAPVTAPTGETDAQRILREFRDKNKKTTGYTPTQERALEAFEKQVGRKPTSTELERLTKKYT